MKVPHRRKKCRVCGRTVSILKDGRPMRHVRERGHSEICPGSYA